MVSDSITTLRSAIPNGVKIHSNFPENDVMVLGNANKLHEALFQIIKNAVQAVTSEGEINIEVIIERDKCFVTIKDDGKGIEENLLHKIRDPFFTTRSAGDGSGLGLTIAINNISQHAGSIDLESMPNEGTSVLIQLPLFIVHE